MFAENSDVRNKSEAWTGISNILTKKSRNDWTKQTWKQLQKYASGVCFKKAQDCFTSSFWNRNRRAHAHFAIYLYYLFLKMFKIIWRCMHNILYQTT